MKRNNEIDRLDALDVRISSEGAVKYLWHLSDGQAIESVILRHEDKTCACISTQVGCPLDCVFCATAQLGFVRNLSKEEIISQVAELINELQKIEGNNAVFERILFMGMGEPLLNYESVVWSVQSIKSRPIFNSPEVFLATVGKTPEKIYELARDAPFIRLWVSLCAADDDLRDKLMPEASSTSIETLLRAGEAYARMVGHAVRVNYLMIDGLTDTCSSAEKLAGLLSGKPFSLQLSKLNPIPECSLRGSTIETIRRFAEFTISQGVPTTIFESKGENIMAACGQLRGQSERGD